MENPKFREGHWFSDSTIQYLYYFVYQTSQSDHFGFFGADYIQIEPTKVVINTAKQLDDKIWRDPLFVLKTLRSLNQRAIKGILK